VVIGYIAIEPMLFGDYFKSAILSMSRRIRSIEGACASLPRRFRHGRHTRSPPPVFWLAFLWRGALSWFLYMKRPDIPAAIKDRCWLSVHAA
jgi:NADH-quinone oxidoreductase subunit L